MYTKTAIVTFFAGLAAAQLHPADGKQEGNAIHRPLNEAVPKCEPFKITWTPSTSNTISLLLVKGPPSNVVKYGPALAEGIVNGGSFSWTPAADLPVTEGITGYGIQIIDDVTGDFQYSTQFAISAGNCKDTTTSSVTASVTGSAAPAPPGPATSYPASSPAAGYSVSSAPANTPVAPSNVYPTQAPYPTTMVSAPAPAGTGAPSHNSTAKPSGHPVANTTTPTLPEQTTNAASGLSAGLSLVGAAAAVAAFML